MKRLRHLFCLDFVWHVIDPDESLWVVECTNCGYTKEVR